MNSENLKDIEKVLYIFSKVKDSAIQAIKEYESQKANYALVEETKKIYFSLDDIIDFLFPKNEIRNYIKFIKKLEWPITIKFLSQLLEGYLSTQYSKEKTVEEIVEDLFIKKFLEYFKG